jgi:hypothetical protein
MLLNVAKFGILHPEHDCLAVILPQFANQVYHPFENDEVCISSYHVRFKSD